MNAKQALGMFAATALVVGAVGAMGFAGAASAANPKLTFCMIDKKLDTTPGVSFIGTGTDPTPVTTYYGQLKQLPADKAAKIAADGKGSDVAHAGIFFFGVDNHVFITNPMERQELWDGNYAFWTNAGYNISGADCAFWEVGAYYPPPV